MIVSINNIIVKQVESQEDIEKCFYIRRKVFIEEQNISENIERDDYDRTSLHYIALYKGKVAGCARLRNIDNYSKIERVAVLKKYRNHGIASNIVQTLTCICKNNNINFITLNSQIYLKDFYSKLGFVAEGNPFQEAGIEHIRMKKILSA